MPDFTSRAGLKLDHALTTFGLNVTAMVCADLGCNVGGFVDCLLQRGAAKIYAIDTGYGVLAWKLRKDPRIIVMERTNAMHVKLPEMVDLVTIDVAWTKQSHILPAALRLVKSTGQIVTLIKPHYEAPRSLLRGGVLPAEHLESVLHTVRQTIVTCGLHIIQETPSPIEGQKGNREVLMLLTGNPAPPPESSGH